MSGYAIADVEEIDELDDGRCPMRPVRHHFGITSFGINAFTGREAGDRILNEHDEADDADRNEELYLVTTGRAVFDLDGERRDMPAGTFNLARCESLAGRTSDAMTISGWRPSAPSGSASTPETTPTSTSFATSPPSARSSEARARR
jgi:hypothetical protein